MTIGVIILSIAYLLFFMQQGIKINIGSGFLNNKFLVRQNFDGQTHTYSYWGNILEFGFVDSLDYVKEDPRNIELYLYKFKQADEVTEIAFADYYFGRDEIYYNGENDDETTWIYSDMGENWAMNECPNEDEDKVKIAKMLYYFGRYDLSENISSVRGNYIFLGVGLLGIAMFVFTKISKKKKDFNLYILSNTGTEKTAESEFDDEYIRTVSGGNLLFLIVGIGMLILAII